MEESPVVQIQNKNKKKNTPWRLVSPWHHQIPHCQCYPRDAVPNTMLHHVHKGESLYVMRYIETRSHNKCCRPKAITIMYSECVFLVWGIQHAKCMCRIIFSPVTCLALQHISTFSHKRNDFRGKKMVMKHNKYVWVFFTTSVWNILHSKKNWARYYNKRT